MNEDFSLIEKSAIPVVPIRDGIVFPQVENALVFGRPKSVAAIHDGFSKDKQIILLLQKSPEKDDPTPEDLYSIGIRATIRKVFAGDNGEVTALIQGQERVRVTELLSIEPYMTAHVQVLPSLDEDDAETEALVRHISNELKHAVNLGKTVDVVYLMNIMGNASPAAFSDFVAMVLDLKVEERQILIEELDTKRRLQLEAEYVTKELKVLELERKIHNKTQKKFEKGMKDAVLREKLKTIEQELGGMPDGLGEDKDMDELKKKILRAKMPPEAHEKAIKELARLAKMAPFNPEVSYVRTYLELMVELPWNKMSKGVLDINKAQKVLDADHYGLKKVKERILEFLAVMKLKEMQAKSKKNSKDVKQPTILCFYGPPGVGKTSIGKSIAKALGREFVKMSLGGVRDEAEIRGHRRTYVGALPGRIIQAIKQAKTKNPVFMLDEIDKVGADYRGDPSSALLEALDPEQNHGFADHYLEVPFDLSNVMFITTANMLDTIPSALRDRLEIITFSGYTEDEKFAIAKNYLLKKQMKANGLASHKVSITDKALKLIIRRYTREAGVRELERQVATVYRKIALEVVEGTTKAKKVIESTVLGYLGQYKYSDQVIEHEDTVGMSTGLAWTQAGGDILLIEVAVMPGKGRLTITGQLGEVMKESCQAAFSYVRARYDLFGLKKNFYSDIDIHIHVPEGAVPKDGPSAGLAIATAMISALTKVPVNRLVGMTGEITLRGRALPIGGVKEKIIAAHRAGLKLIILPKENKKDLEDVPTAVKEDLEFVFVEHMDDVLKRAFVFPRKNFKFADGVVAN